MLKSVLNAHEFPVVTCNTLDVPQGEDLEFWADKMIVRKRNEWSERVSRSVLSDCDPHQALLSKERILEWAAIYFSRGCSWPRGGPNPGLLHWRWILYHLSHQGGPEWMGASLKPGPDLGTQVSSHSKTEGEPMSVRIQHSHHFRCGTIS